MNINELKNMIDNKAERDKAEELRKEKELNDRVDCAKNNIKGLSERITLLMELKDYAENKGINLDNYNPNDSKWKPNRFYTDGIYHKVGFYHDWRVHKNGIGIENGGWNGNIHLIVTDDGVAHGIYEGTADLIEPRLEDMEKFLNNFDEFETRLIEYIKSVCKKGGE